jgi:hypothetical protein
MTIKPWLSKNFLQQMSWSNVRDYPPKKKKPWLFDNFMEMEEIHSDHILEPWPLPNDPPLPPDPDIPQDPEPEDPCLGDRTLRVTALPFSVDCDGSTEVILTFSPDFQCIELKQAFYSSDKARILDSADNTLEFPTNIDDIVGALRIEEGCVESQIITLWAIDCLCGGQASVDIFLDNCGVDCDIVEVDGPTLVATTGSYQYEYTNFPSGAGQVQWAVIGEGASIDQDGTLFTSSACGMLTIIANSNCCGVKTLKVKVNAGVWDGPYTLCDEGGGSGTASCYVDIDLGTRRYYEYKCGTGPSSCAAYSPTPCGSCSEPVPYKQTTFVGNEFWICAP